MNKIKVREKAVIELSKDLSRKINEVLEHYEVNTPELVLAWVTALMAFLDAQKR